MKAINKHGLDSPSRWRLSDCSRIKYISTNLRSDRLQTSAVSLHSLHQNHFSWLDQGMCCWFFNIWTGSGSGHMVKPRLDYNLAVRAITYVLPLCVCAKSLQSWPTLCNPMNCSLPGSSVHGILQAKHWSGLPCPPPGDLLNPGMEPTSLMFPALAGRFSTISATWEALLPLYLIYNHVVSVDWTRFGICLKKKKSQGCT